MLRDPFDAKLAFREMAAFCAVASSLKLVYIFTWLLCDSRHLSNF